MDHLIHGGLCFFRDQTVSGSQLKRTIFFSDVIKSKQFFSQHSNRKQILTSYFI